MSICIQYYFADEQLKVKVIKNVKVKLKVNGSVNTTVIFKFCTSKDLFKHRGFNNFLCDLGNGLKIWVPRVWQMKV